MLLRHSLSTIKRANEPLVVITAYDALFASLFKDIADIILVGDSLNMTFNAQEDTLSVTLEQMIYHTNAVCKGAPESFVILDMPFGSYPTKEDALKNATKVFQQTPCKAVKIEGGEQKASLVKHLCDNGIAVCGHIGLLPQNVRAEGGYKIKGKDTLQSDQLLRDAKALEEAGVFALVIEGVKPEVATHITQKISIPTIGIGAGGGCRGQVLVFSDLLGLSENKAPKFVKQYLNSADAIKKAVTQYATEVRNGIFPSEEFTY